MLSILALTISTQPAVKVWRRATQRTHNWIVESSRPERMREYAKRHYRITNWSARNELLFWLIGNGSERYSAKDLSDYVQMGYQVNGRMLPSGHTPLLYALDVQEFSYVPALLNLGADPNSVTCDGFSGIDILREMYRPGEADSVLLQLRAGGAFVKGLGVGSYHSMRTP